MRTREVDDRSAGAIGTSNGVLDWIEPFVPAPPISSAGALLTHRDVHVWRSWLDQPHWRVRQLAQTLSVDEQERACRFHFERDRTRYIVARGTLRSILGRYLDREPGDLQFVYGLHGKPCLCDEQGRAAIHFNLAHSHRLAVYAFAQRREVGIDLEYVRPIPHLQQIAASFFSAREVATLSSLPPSQQQEAFYLCWTSKEAYVKAKGLGLAQPLDQLDVSLVPGKSARLLRVEGRPEETSRWSPRWLRPAPGYMAALAVEGQDWQPTYYDLQECEPPLDPLPKTTLCSPG